MNSSIYNSESILASERVIKAQIRSNRSKLKTEIDNVQSQDGPILALLTSSENLDDCYEILPYTQILKDNSQSLDQLQRVPNAFDILERYGRHLMKPSKSRSQEWRIIKFVNPIFAEKVDTVEWGRWIIRQLGYTKDISDGLSFEDGSQPTPDKLSNIVVDLVIGRAELEKIFKGEHPKEQRILKHLSLECISSLELSLGRNNSNSLCQTVPNETTQLIDQPSEEKCDICGVEDVCMVCVICEGKKLCFDCDVKWHSHPRRQSHNRDQISASNLFVPQPTINTINTHSNETSPPVASIQHAFVVSTRPAKTALGSQSTTSEALVYTANNNANHFYDTSPQTVPESLHIDRHGAYSFPKEFIRVDYSTSSPASGSFPPPLPDVFQPEAEYDANSPKRNILRQIAALEDQIEDCEIKLKGISASPANFQAEATYYRLNDEKCRLVNSKKELEKILKNITQASEGAVSKTAVGLSLQTPIDKLLEYPETNYGKRKCTPDELNTSHSNILPSTQHIPVHQTMPAVKTSLATNDYSRFTLPPVKGPPPIANSIDICSTIEPVFSPSTWWHCSHCTLLNSPGKNICNACHKTTDNPKLADFNDVVTGATANSQSSSSTGRLGEQIARVYEEADEVSSQKKAAQMKFVKEEKQNSTQMNDQRNSLSDICDSDQRKLKASDETFLVDLTNHHSGDSDKLSLKNSTKGDNNVSSFRVDLTDHHSGDSDKLSLKNSAKGDNSVTSADFSPESLERNQAVRQMWTDGRNMLGLLKDGVKKGYKIEELEIAISMSQDPLDWLKEIWPSMIDFVVTMATQPGEQETADLIGHLSILEAKDLLIKAKGDVEQAVEECVQERTEKFNTIMAAGPFEREDVLRLLREHKGDVNIVLIQLQLEQLKPFLERIWENPEENRPEALLREATQDQVANSIIEHEDFQEMVTNSNIDLQRRIRMVMVEGKLQSSGRAEAVLQILNDMPDEEFALQDVIEAIRNCPDKKSAIAYLQQDCQICFSKYPMSKIRNFTHCQCNLCIDCFIQHLELSIREKFVQNWACPICEQPDIQQNDEAAADHFSFLDMLLPTIVKKEVRDLFQEKLRDWRLMKDPNFRWCTHCGNGFIYNGRNIKMACTACNLYTCFKCKKQWEDQHEGLTCEQYEQWKIDNNPENQATGLNRHLDENGIVCPSCKMRYALAKGGCMHFKCPQCGHEFCSGCSQPFRRAENCNKYSRCQGQGLHCHHPRDCFSHLRDNTVEELQSLLQRANVVFNKDPPAGQENPQKCPVMEQKDALDGKKDEACGKDVEDEHYGLCVSHYKEYLVGLINKKKIDPIVLLSIEQIKIQLTKLDLDVPKKRKDEDDDHYKKRLIKHVKEKVPLMHLEGAAGS